MISNKINVIIEQINQIWQDNDVVELRILNTKQSTQSGYYDDLVALAKAAVAFDGKYNIYATLNPVKPALLARATNRLVTYSKSTTGDSDILERRWLPIDIDPVRPAGISSSVDEKKAAKKVVLDVRKYLTTLGWRNPIVASSGNGYHLLYRIDLPNDQSSRDLIKKVLLTLDLLFSTEKAKVDTSVYNAARIWKLYGTMACKGDNTTERPHRRAKIISKVKNDAK